MGNPKRIVPKPFNEQEWAVNQIMMHNQKLMEALRGVRHAYEHSPPNYHEARFYHYRVDYHTRQINNIRQRYNIPCIRQKQLIGEYYSRYYKKGKSKCYEYYHFFYIPVISDEAPTNS